jgi:hypothetical protein
MEIKLKEIYEKNIFNNIILNEKNIIKSMEESYDLGAKEVLDWLSKMDYLSDNIGYLIDEWENLNKKI